MTKLNPRTIDIVGNVIIAGSDYRKDIKDILRRVRRDEVLQKELPRSRTPHQRPDGSYHLSPVAAAFVGLGMALAAEEELARGVPVTLKTEAISKAMRFATLAVRLAETQGTPDSPAISTELMDELHFAIKDLSFTDHSSSGTINSDPTAQ